MANSIVTNSGAQAAIRSLFTIDRDLKSTQGRIESGLRVGSASDDPAVFSIAQGMRADMSGLKAVQDGLAFGKAAVSLANQTAKKVSDELSSLKQTVTQGQQAGLDRKTINQQIQQHLDSINTFVNSATYNGVNLLKNKEGGAITDTELSFLTDISGSKLTVSNQEITAQDLGLTGLSIETGGVKMNLGKTFADGDSITIGTDSGEKTFLLSANTTAISGLTDDTTVVDISKFSTDGDKVLKALQTAMNAEGVNARVNQDGSLDVFAEGLKSASFDVAAVDAAAITLERGAAGLSATTTVAGTGTGGNAVANDLFKVKVGETDYTFRFTATAADSGKVNSDGEILVAVGANLDATLSSLKTEAEKVLNLADSNFTVSVSGANITVSGEGLTSTQFMDQPPDASVQKFSGNEWTITSATGDGTNIRTLGGTGYKEDGSETTDLTATKSFRNVGTNAIEQVNAAIEKMSSKLSSLGAVDRQVGGLQDFSKTLMDSLKDGLGALVDADMAEESARLQSLQTRQQLAIQSLTMANQGPQALLGLFR